MAGLSTKTSELQAADIEGLSVKNLIKWVRKQVSHCITRADERIMKKAHLTGDALLHHVSEKDLKGEGLSFGTNHQAGIEAPSQVDTMKNDVQEASFEITNTRKSLERKSRRTSEYTEIPQPNYPGLTLLAALCKRRREDTLNHFHSFYKNWEYAKTQLSSPAPRGKDEAYYRYTGREVFSELVDAFKRTTDEKSLASLWVYGLLGNGKSHLLATLVYFLTAQGYRAIYLPDCQIFYRKPVRYLQEALLFAWADVPEKFNTIINLRTMNQVEEFLLQNEEDSVVFVIDQMDALDGPELIEIKTEMRVWLDRCRLNVKSVLSTSANNTTFLDTLNQQNNDYMFTVFGGFTTTEMDAWWDRHGSLNLGEYSRVQVEDWTGKIPLLLDSCAATGVLDFGCKEVRDVVRQSQQFASRMKRSLSEVEWSIYREYIHRCITGSVVPEYINPEHVDHQYFLEKDGVGYCACGIVRETVAKQVFERGFELFSITGSMREMKRNLTSNKAMVGYFLELTVIQTVRTHGFDDPNFEGPMTHILFYGYPRYKHEYTKAVYVPRPFDFPTLDALVLRLDHSKKTAHLIPIQITKARSQSNFEDRFFEEWPHWTRGLEGYEVDVTFLRITADGEQASEVIKNRCCGPRENPATITTKKIPLKELNEEMWRKYQDINDQPPLLLSY